MADNQSEEGPSLPKTPNETPQPVTLGIIDLSRFGLPPELEEKIASYIDFNGWVFDLKSGRYLFAVTAQSLNFTIIDDRPFGHQIRITIGPLACDEQGSEQANSDGS